MLLLRGLLHYIQRIANFKSTQKFVGAVLNPMPAPPAIFYSVDIAFSLYPGGLGISNTDITCSAELMC